MGHRPNRRRFLGQSAAIATGFSPAFAGAVNRTAARHRSERREVSSMIIPRREGEAGPLFEAAVTSAREQGFLQNAAIAAELAGEFHHRRGDTATATRHLRHEPFAGSAPVWRVSSQHSVAGEPTPHSCAWAPSAYPC